MTGQVGAAEVPQVKGLDRLLTVADIAFLLQRPPRYVAGLIKTGSLRGIKLGGNSWRVRRDEWDRFLERSAAAGGAAGFRHARPSGGPRRGMWGYTGGGADENGTGEKAGGYPAGAE